MKKASARNERQARRAKKRELPRCPVCTNQIADSDRTAMVHPETGQRILVHSSCAARIETAKRAQAEARVNAAGLWTPGQEQ